MKILICGDNHWSQYSSIVRQRGEKYSLRLENQIKSINWVEALAVEQECACIIHLGDFFDAPNLCSEEITALKEIEWAEYMPHYFLVGNHEIGTRNLQFNSVNVLTNNTPYEVIDKITNKYWEDIEAVFIPYMFEGDKPELSTLFKTNATKKIIFSHNDIKGIQMGQFISKEGFDIDDIKNSCSLFINGHYHNGEKIGNIINCGNLTGQNFGEDASKYDHVALILDTEIMRVAVFENPYAFNFYKLDFYGADIDYINIISEELKRNAVCSIKCSEKDLHYLKCRFGNEHDDIIPECNKIVCSRFVIVPETSTSGATVSEELSQVDHLNLFREYILQTLGNSEVITSELAEVCK